jgi:hypothetical protein
MAWNFRWAAPGVAIADAYGMDVVRYRSLIGASGPPYNVVNEEQPFRPGSYLKTITVDEAEVDLTMLLKGTSQTNLWQSLALLPPLFNPTATDADGNFGGRLLVSTPASGLSRFLSCVCLSGFKIDEASLLQKSVEATLTFYANYPYWQASIASESQGTPFGKKPKWFPLFPLLLGGGAENYVDITVTNNGDVPAYPTITIRGPGSQPKVTNRTLPTGTGLFPLTANGGVVLSNNTQSITIDMLNRTVIRNNGNSEINKLAYTGTFWALTPGQNVIRIRMDGVPAVSASTSISITWRDTYSSIM